MFTNENFFAAYQQVRVESVPEEINCEVAFDDDFYQFSVDERSTGSFGSVSFSNKSYPLSIWWTLPDGFKGICTLNRTFSFSTLLDLIQFTVQTKIGNNFTARFV